MPLDQQGFELPALTEAEILDRMIERLSRPGGWCQDRLENGPSVCVLGALNFADHGYPLWRSRLAGYTMSTDAGEAVYRTLMQELSPQKDKSFHQAIPNWNNAPDRTQADVIDLLRRVRAKTP